MIPVWIIHTPRLIRFSGIRRIVVTVRFRQMRSMSVSNGHQWNHSNSVSSKARISRTATQEAGLKMLGCTGTPDEPTEQYTNSSRSRMTPSQMLLNRLSTGVMTVLNTYRSPEGERMVAAWRSANRAAVVLW